MLLQDLIAFSLAIKEQLVITECSFMALKHIY